MGLKPFLKGGVYVSWVQNTYRNLCCCQCVNDVALDRIHHEPCGSWKTKTIGNSGNKHIYIQYIVVIIITKIYSQLLGGVGYFCVDPKCGV
jgi:hypothetical protein